MSNLSGWPASALLTAAMVYGLQRLVRLRGGEFAGLVAAAPLTSAPALLSLAHARGAVEGGQAAMVGLHLTAIVAVALLILLRLVPRKWLTPAGHAIPAAPGASALPDACGALCAGLLTGACLAASPLLSVAACGVLACLPWTSLGALACCMRLHGPARATRFLLGYAQGLAPRLVFFGSVALLMPLLGGPSAVLLALATGAATLIVQRSAIRLAPRLVPRLNLHKPRRTPTRVAAVDVSCSLSLNGSHEKAV